MNVPCPAKCGSIFRLLCFLFLGLTALQLSAQITDIATDATDPSNLGDTEPSIAVNPVNPNEIVVVTFSEAWNATTGAPVWRTTDGGTTWNKIRILPRPGASSAPGDQKVQFDRTGNLFIAELAGGMAQPRCLIYRQTGAAGTNLTGGAFYGDDQPMLDIDKTATSAFDGNIYSAWLDFSAAREVSTVARSTNDGVTVTNVVAGNNASFPNRTTRSTVAPDGSAYIIFKTREGAITGGFENAHFWVKRSDDGGVTWTGLGANGISVHGATQVQTWFTTSWGNPAKGKVARARSSDAWIAADPGDGDIYAVFCDQDASGFGQIFLARSTDRGSTWTTIRVTDGTHHSAYPEVAVASNGAIGVQYIDFDDAGVSTIFRHRFARSFNNGSSWNDEILQSMVPGGIADPGGIANARNEFLWGDYEGLAAEGLNFYGVFTGESIGRTTRQLDPIFYTRRAAPDAPSSEIPAVPMKNKVCKCCKTLIYSGRVKMQPGVPPDGNKHIRHAQIILDAFFKDPPAVSATVWAENNVGVMFAIYNIKFNLTATGTNVDIEAQNVQIGQTSDLTYFCDYVIIGTKKR